MKTTGIIRRVDDLGRIVIPKEIRRILRIFEGDELEIYIDKDSVTFKKYSDMNKHFIKLATDIKDSYIKRYGGDIAICDTSCYLVTNNYNKVLEGKPLSDEVRQALQQRMTIRHKYQNCPATNESKDYVFYTIPIIVDGELEGGICLLNEPDFTEEQVFVAETLALLMSKQMSNNK